MGYFWGWEDIDGSLDKIMKIKMSLFGKIYRYRVAMEESEEWENGGNHFKKRITKTPERQYNYHLSQNTCVFLLRCKCPGKRQAQLSNLQLTI